MGATKSSIPTLRASMFELGERELPEHHEALPRRNMLDGNLWAIESIVVGGQGQKIIIAGNIQDQDLLATLISARFGHLSKAFDRLAEGYGLERHFNGDEVIPVVPRDHLEPLYKEGLSVPPESVFPDPSVAVEPAGRIATGNSGGIVPVPAFNPA